MKKRQATTFLHRCVFGSIIFAYVNHFSVHQQMFQLENMCNVYSISFSLLYTNTSLKTAVLPFTTWETYGTLQQVKEVARLPADNLVRWRGQGENG